MADSTARRLPVGRAVPGPPQMGPPSSGGAAQHEAVGSAPRRAGDGPPYGLWLLFSMVVHGFLFLVLWRSSLIARAAEMQPIAVTILAAPPPPPPPPPAGAEIAVEAPVEQIPSKAPAEDSIARIEPTVKPTPRETRKPRAKATPQAENRIVQAPQPGGVEGGVTGGTEGGVDAGVLGGQLGGVVGGKVGGTLGGTGDEAIRADLVASPPSVLSQVRPKYPPMARARGLEGVVVLELIIDREGRVESDSIKVKKSASSFDAPAAEAVRQWRFRPGRDKGSRTVRVILEVPIRFQLR